MLYGEIQYSSTLRSFMVSEPKSSMANSSSSSSSMTNPVCKQSPFSLPNQTTTASTSQATTFLTIKLQNSNYLYWKTMITPYLIVHDLMPFVDGRKPCPSTTIVTPSPDPSTQASTEDHNSDYEVWVKQDQLIISLMLSTLAPELIHLVVDCSTSKEVWDNLKEALASPSQTRILNLHVSLQSLEQDDLGITEYLQKPKGIADELARIGKPLTLSELNLYIYKGLRSEFKDLVRLREVIRCHSMSCVLCF